MQGPGKSDGSHKNSGACNESKSKSKFNFGSGTRGEENQEQAKVAPFMFLWLMTEKKKYIKNITQWNK